MINTVGEMLRRARLARGLTVDDLSVCTGITSRAITSYETGTRDFYKASFKTVVTLADWLGLGLDDLAYLATHGRGCNCETQKTLFED